MEAFVESEGMDQNIRLLLNTKATELVMDDGSAVGVTASAQNTCITYDGLLVDDNSACVDAQGNAIPGLYALGEVNGMGGLYTSGLSVAWTRAMLSVA